MEVFENLGEEKAKELFEKFKAEGMSDDDAFSEVYAIECNLDNEEDEEANGYHALWYIGEPACDLDMREEVEETNRDLDCLENKDMAIYMG